VSNTAEFAPGYRLRQRRHEGYCAFAFTGSLPDAKREDRDEHRRDPRGGIHGDPPVARSPRIVDELLGANDDRPGSSVADAPAPPPADNRNQCAKEV
jgi:hypothetical protein